MRARRSGGYRVGMRREERNKEDKDEESRKITGGGGQERGAGRGEKGEIFSAETRRDVQGHVRGDGNSETIQDELPGRS